MKPTYPESLEWLPDWTDPTCYPPVEGTSRTQWAWEFLIRNPEYQAAYSKFRDYFSRWLGVMSPNPTEELDMSFVQRFHLADAIPPQIPGSDA